MIPQYIGALQAAYPLRSSTAFHNRKRFVAMARTSSSLGGHSTGPPASPHNVAAVPAVPCLGGYRNAVCNAEITADIRTGQGI